MTRRALERLADPVGWIILGLAVLLYLALASPADAAPDGPGAGDFLKLHAMVLGGLFVAGVPVALHHTSRESRNG